jgi:hypothetical protein
MISRERKRGETVAKASGAETVQRCIVRSCAGVVNAWSGGMGVPFASTLGGVIHMDTAQPLGLIIPPSLLSYADKVIRSLPTCELSNTSVTNRL